MKQSPESVYAALQEPHQTEPFSLVLQERVHKQAMLYDYTPKMRLHSSLITNESVGSPAWTAFIDTVQNLPLPYVRIEQLVKPTTLLGVSSGGEDAAIQMIAEAMRQNHGVAQMFNAWRRC